MNQECIMDMSFIRTYYDGITKKYPNIELLGTLYNFHDLLSSKDSGPENIDGRLEFLKNEVLKRMINEEIIIWEPFYEIIKENYPYINYGSTIYKRIYEDFLPYIEEIRMNGKEVRQEIKKAVVKFSEENQTRKRKQIQNFQKYSTYFKNQIISEGNNPSELSSWIPKAQILLKNPDIFNSTCRALSMGRLRK